MKANNLNYSSASASMAMSTEPFDSQAQPFLVPSSALTLAGAATLQSVSALLLAKVQNHHRLSQTELALVQAMAASLDRRHEKTLAEIAVEHPAWLAFQPEQIDDILSRPSTYVRSVGWLCKVLIKLSLAWIFLIGSPEYLLVIPSKVFKATYQGLTYGWSTECEDWYRCNQE